MTSTRPITLLIAALGGEGGGVLTGWIVAAAEQAGFPVQSTSIPGVAQRTGATTYYIEIFPVKTAELGSKRPVLALTPGVGDIDIAVASELLEAGRTVANGFVTPDRTHAIASLSRFYAVDEKIAMGDGRFDQDRLIKVIKEHARDCLLIDMARLAEQSGSIINAVMLGAIAGSGRLPLTLEQLEAAVRADGKSVDSNLAGLRAGFAAAGAKTQPAITVENKRNAPVTPALLEHEVSYSMPALAQPTAIEGVRRLIAYQGLAYAKLYLDRLRPITDADEAASAHGRLLKEVARHLAVRMSYEDVVRVAQAKISPARMRRIAREELRVTNEPFSVHDFLKPGIEEFCQLLPSFLARPILRVSERKGWLGRFHIGMEINSTSISGYLRFLMLAKLRRLRPFGHRYKQEQMQIESWLGLIAKAAGQSLDLGLEIAECSRLIKGYGDTHVRGLANFAIIADRLIGPALAGQIPSPRAADAIASARTAALLDPEGEGLAKCLAEIEGQSALRIAAE
ncbi:MAG: indolepyruvate oxidoreductase subunit beta family protein [Rhizobiales bacterium]|nr:indolepyruvate oxidoreductase subunit beta family protein [Hyphomicrobiales bacterium]